MAHDEEKNNSGPPHDHGITFKTVKVVDPLSVMYQSHDAQSIKALKDHCFNGDTSPYLASIRGPHPYSLYKCCYWLYTNL